MREHHQRVLTHVARLIAQSTMRRKKSCHGWLLKARMNFPPLMARERQPNNGWFLNRFNSFSSIFCSLHFDNRKVFVKFFR